ncbi:MAG: family 43 glycosylhydrolase [Chitinophagaceae bacterium]|nr:family 43 glycosylhydrolase [Chitinophagaceae bacterium]
MMSIQNTKTNRIFIVIYLLMFFAMPLLTYSQDDNASIRFVYQNITGIGFEKGCTRRDPSDIIKVKDTCYVYYTKVYGRAPGYWGTIWYATSIDEGHSWTEKGEILSAGLEGDFDSHAVFTPNIIFANNKYYLYYTGVKPTPGNQDHKFENNATTDITAIGLAVSFSPCGPFKRVCNNPVLTISADPKAFDSYRIDDASLLYRNGLYWLYYKGRSRLYEEKGPSHTQMGVAFSRVPEGPFIKYDSPLLDGSHEVLLWQQGYGIAALASISSTVEYAADGIDFNTHKLALKVTNTPIAPGVFRTDLTKRNIRGEGARWGISMVLNGKECYLQRYEVIGNIPVW